MQSIISLLLCMLALAVLSSCHFMRSSASNDSINVMTFNVRYNNPNDGENAWPQRQELVANPVYVLKPKLHVSHFHVSPRRLYP